MDRKKFIFTLGRFSILAIGLAFIVIFMRRKQIQPKAKCTAPVSSCNGCVSLSTCNLPDAIEYKEKDSDEK